METRFPRTAGHRPRRRRCRRLRRSGKRACQESLEFASRFLEGELRDGGRIRKYGVRPLSLRELPRMKVNPVAGGFDPVFPNSASVPQFALLARCLIIIGV